VLSETADILLLSAGLVVLAEAAGLAAFGWAAGFLGAIVVVDAVSCRVATDSGRAAGRVEPDVPAGVLSVVPAAVRSAAAVCPLSAVVTEPDRRSPPHPRANVRHKPQEIPVKPPFISNHPLCELDAGAAARTLRSFLPAER
jgi:hypothetical protein